MKNWIYYQIAMYYVRKAKRIPNLTDGNNFELWENYMKKSRAWITKIII